MFQVSWGRTLLLSAAALASFWAAVSLAIFVLFKYVKDYDEMTFFQALTVPFDRAGHRHRVGEYNFRTAKKNMKDGKWRDAYMNLLSAVGRDPKNLEARMLLAEFHRYLGNKPDLAISALEGALAYAVDNPEYMRMYVKLLVDQSEDSKVVSVCEKLLNSGRVKNRDIAAYLAMSLSTVYAFHGDYAKSKQWLEKYNLGKTLPGILRLSRNEWEQGNRDGAVKILADNFGLVKDREPVYSLLVDYYCAMNDFEKARRYAMLRNVENPFSLEQKTEYLRLLKKTGDENGARRDFDQLVKRHQNDNRSLLILANYAADTADADAMRRVYDIAVKRNYNPGPYCLLRLETEVNAGNYKSATEFADEFIKRKPVWLERYKDVVSCLRAIAYYATGNANMADILLNEVLERGTVSPNVQIATAKRLGNMGANMTALKLLENATNRFPNHQLALVRLIQTEIELGNSTNLNKHISTLLRMRLPPRELATDVRKRLASDRFIFAANRTELINEIDSLVKGGTAKAFSESGGLDGGNERITPSGFQNRNF